MGTSFDTVVRSFPIDAHSISIVQILEDAKEAAHCPTILSHVPPDRYRVVTSIRDVRRIDANHRELERTQASILVRLSGIAG